MLLCHRVRRVVKQSRLSKGLVQNTRPPCCIPHGFPRNQSSHFIDFSRFFSDARLEEPSNGEPHLPPSQATIDAFTLSSCFFCFLPGGLDHHDPSRHRENDVIDWLALALKCYARYANTPCNLEFQLLTYGSCEGLQASLYRPSPVNAVDMPPD